MRARPRVTGGLAPNGGQARLFKAAPRCAGKRAAPGLLREWFVSAGRRRRGKSDRAMACDPTVTGIAALRGVELRNGAGLLIPASTRLRSAGHVRSGWPGKGCDPIFPAFPADLSARKRCGRIVAELPRTACLASALAGGKFLAHRGNRGCSSRAGRDGAGPACGQRSPARLPRGRRGPNQQGPCLPFFAACSCPPCSR